MICVHILPYREIKQCLFQSVKYPLLSPNTFATSLAIVLAFVISWLSLAGVPDSEVNSEFYLTSALYFLFVVAVISWSMKMPGFSVRLFTLITAAFTLDIIMLNVSGMGIPAVLKTLTSEGPAHTLTASNAYNALGRLNAMNSFYSIWPGFNWLSLAFILFSSCRTRITSLTNLVLHMLINLPVCALQILVFVSLNTLFMLISPLTSLTLLFVPLLSVWNCVFIFLVIIRIEAGQSPDVIMSKIASIKLSLRK